MKKQHHPSGSRGFPHRNDHIMQIEEFAACELVRGTAQNKATGLAQKKVAAEAEKTRPSDQTRN
ncbi:hypothetical protein GCM10009753_79300 [Streptantibioticus ferralitis]